MVRATMEILILASVLSVHWDAVLARCQELILFVQLVQLWQELTTISIMAIAMLFVLKLPITNLNSVIPIV